MANSLIKICFFFGFLFLIKYYSFFYVTLPVREFVSDASSPTLVTFVLFNFSFKFFFYLLKFIVVASILSVGLLLSEGHDQRSSFGKLISIAVTAEFIFLVGDVMKIVYFSFFLVEFEEQQYVNFYPLSIFNLLDVDSSSVFAYVLQTLNVFEGLYVICLSYYISLFLKSPFVDAFRVVIVTYLPCLFVWVIVITYISL